MPYLTHAGFIFNPLGPSTTPPGMRRPARGWGRSTSPRPGGEGEEEGEEVVAVPTFFGGLGFMSGFAPQGPVPGPLVRRALATSGRECLSRAVAGGRTPRFKELLCAPE